jgi:hypothetical protein
LLAAKSIDNILTLPHEILLKELGKNMHIFEKYFVKASISKLETGKLLLMEFHGIDRIHIFSVLSSILGMLLKGREWALFI